MLLDVPIRVVQSSEPGSQARYVEIHEQPSRVTREPQIGQNLREMDRMQALNGLQLNDQTALNQQVEPQRTSDWSTFVFEWDTLLDFDVKAIHVQLHGQALAIDGFQQSWSERSMHFDRAANHTLGQRVDFVVSANHGDKWSMTRANRFPANSAKLG